MVTWILLLAVALLALLLGSTLVMAWYHKSQSVGYQRSLATANDRLQIEYQRRCDYERTLALPFWSSDAEMEKELWARAHAGDEICQELLEIRLLRIAEASKDTASELPSV